MELMITWRMRASPGPVRCLRGALGVVGALLRVFKRSAKGLGEEPAQRTAYSYLFKLPKLRPESTAKTAKELPRKEQQGRKCDRVEGVVGGHQIQKERGTAEGGDALKGERRGR